MAHTSRMLSLDRCSRLVVATCSCSLLVAAAVEAGLGCGGKAVIDGAGATSSAGTTHTDGGSTGECPAIAPHDGEACSSAGLTCLLSALCCEPTATCSGGTWHVPPPTCPQPPCYACYSVDDRCSTDALCVVDFPGGDDTYHCAENPCGDQPVDCTCAASLCPTGCLESTDFTVVCNPSYD